MNKTRHFETCVSSNSSGNIRQVYDNYGNRFHKPLTFHPLNLLPFIFDKGSPTTVEASVSINNYGVLYQKQTFNSILGPARGNLKICYLKLLSW